MTNRYLDWLRQARRDLDHARHAAAAADHEWACFAAQQAAEKAVKSWLLYRGGEGWGHSVTLLLTNLREHTNVPEEQLEAARRLDRHYIPTRYPNGFDAGVPGDYYTNQDAVEAIANAERILDFISQQVC